jgi:hypothetical protein
MEHNPSVLSLGKKGKVSNKSRKRRDTTLTRVDRSVYGKLKLLSLRQGETMSVINDRALTEYIDSLTPSM